MTESRSIDLNIESRSIDFSDGLCWKISNCKGDIVSWKKKEKRAKHHDQHHQSQAPQESVVLISQAGQNITGKTGLWASWESYLYRFFRALPILARLSSSIRPLLLIQEPSLLRKGLRKRSEKRSCGGRRERSRKGKRTTSTVRTYAYTFTCASARNIIRWGSHRANAKRISLREYALSRDALGFEPSPYKSGRGIDALPSLSSFPSDKDDLDVFNDSNQWSTSFVFLQSFSPLTFRT